MAFDYDVLVIGSGFGGSVTALRLTEKGYRVGVLEAGRRFAPSDFPKTSWRSRRYLWAPRLGCTGLQRIHLIGGDKRSRVLVMAGAGVGGGSLVYSNTLYEPLQPFYDDPQWKDITDWRAELAPFYDQAKRMLGVTINPTMTAADEAVKTVAEKMGRGSTFHRTPLGILFGSSPGVEVDDPFFGGAGPARRTCIECGACQTGCRYGAKNTLTQNYLYLAEQAGTVVHPLTTVTSLRALDGGGYGVSTVRTGSWVGRGRRTFTAAQVVVAAGTYGTQKLLHRMRATGVLPALSSRLGVLTRTNSEAILGVERLSQRGPDHTRGASLTSSFHPDEDTHCEPVRYGKGSNAMGLLRTLLVDGDRRGPRWVGFFVEVFRHPVTAVRMASLRNWSGRTIIVAAMQARNNSITLAPKRRLLGGWKVASSPGHGEPSPTWIPIAHRVVRMLAEETGSIAGGTWLDLFNIPTTAHFLGGCAIGDSPSTGVIDAYHRVYGYDGLHIVDGSAVSANLGVNPSLTITAQAERAMSLWPNAGEADPRPALGSSYQRLAPVTPKNPVVPATAPAALRLPVVSP